MACLTANLPVLHKMNPVAHSCQLHGLPIIMQFAPTQSDVVCSFGVRNHAEPLPKSCFCDIKMVNSLWERTSADVCLKKSQGSWMKQTLNIMSWCTVSIDIPHIVTVKMQILFCSSQLSIPTWTLKRQLPSMSSISCNIQHLVHQQS